MRTVPFTKWALVALVALAAIPLAKAENLSVRELARAIVFQCEVPWATPVEPVPTAEFWFPTMNCIVVDTRVDTDSHAGNLFLLEEEIGGKIIDMAFDAEIWVDGEQYTVNDWVDALSFEANGSRYLVKSRQYLDWEGNGIEYPITFLRRTPDLCDNGEALEPCRDRTTLFMVELKTGTYAFLDYRPVDVAAPK